ncbi:MAG: glycine cleavage system protein GcvH [Desulfomonilaceae bacterium]
MEAPEDRLYSQHHLWVKLEKDQAVIGITDYAAEEIGEVDYIELPEPNDTVSKERAFGALETSKAITDLICPISGVVLDCNMLLTESPEMVTDDPYGDGWLMVLQPSDPDEWDDLMKAGDYEKLVRSAVEE